MKKITCRYCNQTFVLTHSQKIQWQKNKCICPHCHIDWCILPPTERQLKQLQDIYLQDRNPDVLSHIAYILFHYAQSLIKKKFNIHLRKKYDLFDYSYNATVFVIEDYLSKKDFKIETSFAGYLLFKIKQAIFYQDKYDKNTLYSLNYEFQDKNQLEEVLQSKNFILQPQVDLLDRIEQKEYNLYIFKKIILLLDEIKQYCSPALDYIRILGLYLFFYKGENNFNMFFNYIDRQGKDITIKTLDILKKELYNTNNV